MTLVCIITKKKKINKNLKLGANNASNNTAISVSVIRLSAKVSKSLNYLHGCTYLLLIVYMIYYRTVDFENELLSTVNWPFNGEHIMFFSSGPHKINND